MISGINDYMCGKYCTLNEAMGWNYLCPKECHTIDTPCCNKSVLEILWDRMIQRPC